MADIYLAGRVAWGDEVLPKFAQELEERGHSITRKWWELGRLPKPYLENYESSKEAATLMAKAVADSSITILFAEDNILGAATEFGIAIGDTSKAREVIVVTPEDVRESVFYAHPAVRIARSLDDVRNFDWY